jgi:branched-chain amino acid transport system substrate-binding protein
MTATTATSAPATAAPAEPPPTTTTWGVQPGGTLLGPSGFTVDLNRCGAGWADHAGLTTDTIVIGASAPLSGPYAAFGRLLTGMRARLDAANAAGGIDGRRVEVTVLEDGWDAVVSGANAATLADDGVLAFAGTFGTKQNLAVSGVAEGRCIPLLAVSNSAAFGDALDRPWSVGTVGSWPAEMLVTVQQIAAAQPAGARLALVVDDEPELTPEVIRAAQAAVARVPGTELLPAVYLPRDGSGIATALAQITAAEPTAIIVAANERGASPILTAISETAIAADQRWTTSGTMAALSTARAGGWRLVRTTEVPTVAATPFQADFLTATVDVAAADRAAFWLGYVQGEVLLIALREAAVRPGGLSRTNLLLALRSLDAEHPGLAGARLHTDGAADPWPVEAGIVTSYDGSSYTTIGVADVDGQTAR